MHRFKKKILHDKDRREYGGTKNGPGFDEKKKKKQTKQKTTDLKDGCSKFEQKYKHW